METLERIAEEAKIISDNELLCGVLDKVAEAMLLFADGDESGAMKIAWKLKNFMFDYQEIIIGGEAW